MNNPALDGRAQQPTAQGPSPAGMSPEQLEQLRQALLESLNLQSHYAFLLNAYDGGKRRQFCSIDEWLGYLHMTSMR